MSQDLQAYELPGGVQGVVSFPQNLEASYRFTIRVVKGEKLSVWLEHRKTKQQWLSAELGIGDIVTEKNTIPMSTFHDYVKCFLNCLQSPNDSKEFSRELLHAPSSLTLLLTLNLRVFGSVWTPTYSIALKEVKLDPVDVVAAKLRDAEEKIEALQLAIEQPCSNVPRTTLPVSGTLKTQCQNTNLQWVLPDAPEVKLRKNSELHIVEDGVYFVYLVAQVAYSYNASCTLVMQANGAQIVSDTVSGTQQQTHTITLFQMLAAKSGDKWTFSISGAYCTITSANLSILKL